MELLMDNGGELRLRRNLTTTYRNDISDSPFFVAAMWLLMFWSIVQMRQEVSGARHNVIMMSRHRIIR